MDLGAGLTDFAVHALLLQAGVAVALAAALAGATACARRRAEARGAQITAENDFVIKNAGAVFENVTRTIKKGVAPVRPPVIE